MSTPTAVHNLRHFLALAQHGRFLTGVVHRRLHRRLNDSEKLIRADAGRQDGSREVVGALDDEDVGVRQFGHPAVADWPVEIARVEQRLSAVFGQEHGGAETMPAGKVVSRSPPHSIGFR